MTQPQPPCRWCGDPDPDATETLTISPHLDPTQIIDAIVEAAAEQPRNDQWVEQHEARFLGEREPEVVAESVHPNAVLTLGEVKKAIRQVSMRSALRAETEIEICEWCAESIERVTDPPEYQ